MEEIRDCWEERTSQCGTGAISKKPHPNPLAYAADIHRQSSASASSVLPLAAQVDEPDPGKDTVACKPDVARSKVGAQNGVCALPGRD